MSKKVFVTGMGIICSIGKDMPEVLESLKNNRTGIGMITMLDTIHKGVLPVAEVKFQNEDLAKMCNIPGAELQTRTALLGCIAARQAMENAGTMMTGHQRTGLISATTVGGMDRSENFYVQFLENSSNGRLRDVIHHDCADSTETIAKALNIHDFVTTVSTACSSSINSLIFGANLIRTGRLDCVIAGGTDSINRFTLNGFNTLMILDKNGCHPFDEHRAGLTLGEGAAYLVMESEDSAMRNNRKIIAEISGYANANDAYHQTASSPDGHGAWLAMSGALNHSGLAPEEIGYINVHGTGTQNNDLTEGLAIERLFAPSVPPFSSTKGFTGHTLGAAGAVESVISLLALQNRMIFPNAGFSNPMKELNIKPVSILKTDVALKHVLSNSFGFGGNNASIVFSRPEFLK